MPLTAATLLQEIETLDYTTRVRRMIELGRQSASDSVVAETLATLADGGAYERRLALQSCYGSHDGGLVLRALADPARSVRMLAIALVPTACDDAQVLDALEQLAAGGHGRTLRRLLFKLYRQRSNGQQLLDIWIAASIARATPDAIEQLPYASETVVSDHLNAWAERASAVDWGKLARLHPTVTVRVLRQMAEQATSYDRRLASIAHATLESLADQLPDDTLAVVDLLRRHIPLVQLSPSLQRLTRLRPTEVADRVLAEGGHTSISFERVVRALDTERILMLLERQPETLRHVSGWFARLSPEQRGNIFSRAGRSWRDTSGAVDPSIVALLPHAAREREARRCLTLPELASNSQARLSYAAFLPWDEARQLLGPFLHHPDATLRIVALHTIIAAVRYDRDRLPEALALVHARRNEQDPARGSMLHALADLPPGRWQTEHLDPLGAIVRDTLDASDLSSASFSYASQIVMQLLPAHPEWAGQWLATLAREGGSLSSWGYSPAWRSNYTWHRFHSPSLAGRLSDDDVRRLAVPLRPVLDSWLTMEMEEEIVQLASLLGNRLRVFDHLLNQLESLARDTRLAYVADHALRLLTSHAPRRLVALIPELLANDASWITQSPVHNWLHLQRQDLLTPFLGQHAWSGRFATGHTTFVLPFTTGFQCWVPTQQQTFATTLTAIADETSRDHWSRQRAIQQLAALPDVTPDALIALAAVEQPAATRDTAIHALGRLDTPLGVPTLLDALGDDRARVAIYALRRVVRDMLPDQALTLLRAVPVERVTVAKEVVRLIGELSLDAALQELLALAARELHRDVRVALLRALWNWIEHDETWPLLEEAVRSTDPALASGVIQIPADRLSPTAQRRLANLLATLLVHPAPEIRVATLQRSANLPLGDPDRTLLPPLLSALTSRISNEMKLAASAVISTYAESDPTLIGTTTSAILPNRRATQNMIDTLQGQAKWTGTRLLPAVRAAFDALETDPLTVGLRLSLAAQTLPPDELRQILEYATTTGLLDAEALVRVAAILESRYRRSSLASWSAVEDTALEPSSEYERMEFALAASSDAALRRLALATLLGSTDDPRGWDEARLARLYTYRSDPSPLVAAPAQFTFPLEDNEIDVE